jgi:putative salt-induced outer membrane protein YdiY
MRIRTWVVAVSCLASTASAWAADPCATPTPSALTGSLGAGFAHTGGNTDTTSVNVSFALQYDPKTKNVVKAAGLYLRGRTEDTDTVNQTTVGVRDEYKLSERAFAFADVHYLHDTFKAVSYLVNPLAGVGYQVVKTPATVLAVDVAVGGAFEKDEGFDSTTSGAYHAGESFAHKLSPTASITQNATAVWKTSDSADALYHFDVSLATAVTRHSELKVSFLDDIKNKPATPTTEKSDTAIVMAFVMKF